MDNRRNSSARAERNRFKYGICCNRDMNGEGKKCPNCESGEVFKIRATEEFVCPECGGALKEVPAPDRPPKLYAIIAAVIVVAAGASCFLFSGKSDNAGQQIVEQPDTTTVQPIETPVQDTPVVEEPQAEQTKAEDTPAVSHQTKPALDWGKYDGPLNGNGEPHGTMGTVIVTKTHVIDLKTSDGKTVTVKSGDKIIDCKFLDGRLVRGEIHFGNGERQVIEIG